MHPRLRKLKALVQAQHRGAPVSLLSSGEWAPDEAGRLLRNVERALSLVRTWFYFRLPLPALLLRLLPRRGSLQVCTRPLCHRPAHLADTMHMRTPHRSSTRAHALGLSQDSINRLAPLGSGGDAPCASRVTPCGYGGSRTIRRSSRRSFATPSTSVAPCMHRHRRYPARSELLGLLHASMGTSRLIIIIIIIIIICS